MCYFAVQSWADESKVIPRRISSTCKTCDVLRQRVAKGHKPRSNQLGVKSGPKGYEPETLDEWEAYRKYQRDKHAAMSEEQRQDRREYQRVYAEAKRREAGIKPRKREPVSTFKSSVPQLGEPVLPAGPLIKFLEEMIHRHGQNATLLAANLSWETLQNLIRGVTRTVTLELADRVLTGLGYPEELYILYPQEEESDG